MTHHFLGVHPSCADLTKLTRFEHGTTTVLLQCLVRQATRRRRHDSARNSQCVKWGYFTSLEVLVVVSLAEVLILQGLEQRGAITELRPLISRGIDPPLRWR